MRLTLIGLPCSGKGTYGPALADRFGVPRIVISDLMRLRAGVGDEVSEHIIRRIQEGKLVDDFIVTQTLVERLAEADARSGFVLDGYPRRSEQGDTLQRALAALPEACKLDAAIHLDIALEESRRRLSARLVCGTCGRSTNASITRSAGPCPAPGCHGTVTPRDDDVDPAAVDERLRTYVGETSPLLDYYRDSGLLIEFNAEGDTDVVLAGITARLGERAGRLPSTLA
jgi:adenylate kinase